MLLDGQSYSWRCVTIWGSDGWKTMLAPHKEEEPENRCIEATKKARLKWIT